MEFHGTRSAPISLTRAVPWNSMEFHGTFNFPKKSSMEFRGTFFEVPWNSMELDKFHIKKFIFLNIVFGV